jgi:hypothetical protein
MAMESMRRFARDVMPAFAGDAPGAGAQRAAAARPQWEATLTW